MSILPSGAGNEMEKLQTNLALGIGSNFFTIAGVLVAWVLLMKTGWQDGFWEPILTALAIAPAMMGDALDSYFLNRVRVDTEKGWNDVFMTETGRKHLGRFHGLYRLHSLLSAGFLAAILLVGFSSSPADFVWFRPVFGALFLTLSIRCLWVQIRFLAPALNSRRSPAFGKRWLFAVSLGALWFWWLYSRDPIKPFSPIGMALHGMIYFLLSGFLHPLPSRFSLLNMNKPSRPRLPQEIKVFPPGTPNPVLETSLKDQIPLWQAAGFTPVAIFGMPLVEMPIFQTVGEAYLGPDKSCLLLLQTCEGKDRPHRTLVSWSGDDVAITSDFGAASARFPEKIKYQPVEADLPPADMLSNHQTFSAFSPTPLPEQPWQLVNHLLGRMIVFLRTELVAAKPPQP